MGRFTALIIGIVVGGLLMLFSFNYHIVRTSDTVLFVPKTTTQLQGAYVDITGWKASDWVEQKAFTKAMIDAGHSDLVQSSVTQDLMDRVLGGFGQPTSQK